MNNPKERGERASRAAEKRRGKRPDPFLVLLAIHRPKYRARAERAVEVFGWMGRSLLIKEDPIGLMNQKKPDIFIISVDATKKAGVGYLRACQRFRAEGMRIIALFENEQELQEFAGQYDVALSPPWKTFELRNIAAHFYEEIRGEHADQITSTAFEDEVEDDEE